MLLPAGTLIGARYRVVRHLGSGAMGSVFEVRDLVQGEQAVALKLIPLIASSGEPAALEALRTEFVTLAGVRHPNILRVLDFGVTSVAIPGAKEERTSWFFTSELVEGRGLLEAAAGGTIADLERWAIQLADALDHLHVRGLIHRDLKPENVRVDLAGQVRLMDFGLASRAASEAGVSRENAAGTPDYLAPEVIQGQAFDPRSDLYAFGAVLYHALCGRPPFVGDDVAAVLRQQVNGTPEAPCRFRPDLPPALETLILRLLAKDPRDRAASAAHVRRELAALLGGEAEAILEQATVRESRLRLNELFERTAELELLTELFARVRTADLESRPSRVVLVAGEAGCGKSRLIASFLQQLMLAGVPVAAGAGHGEPRPLGAVARVVGQAAALGGTAVQREHAPLLARLADGEHGGRSERGRAALPPAAERMRLAHDIGAFLAAVSAQEPLVVHFADLEECDEATLEIVDYLGRNPVAGRLFLIAEARTPIAHPHLAELARKDEAGTDSRTEAGSVTSLELAPFTSAAAARFVDALLGGEAPAPVRDWIASQTGLAVVIVEALRALVRDGALRFDGERWVLERELPAEMQGTAAIVGAKFAGLAAAAESTLALVAAATGPLPEALLAEAAQELAASEEGTPAGSDVALELVRDRLLQLASVDAGIQAFSFPSRLEQTVFWTRIAADRRVRLHRALAQAHERLAPLPEALAHHHAEAGAGAVAVPHALRAARRAERLASDDAARKWYEIALRFATVKAERRRILERMAESCRRSGLYDEATAHLEEALELAAERFAGRLHDLLGQVDLDRGDLDLAERAFTRANKLLERAPVRRLLVLVNLAWVHLYRGNREQALKHCQVALAATRPAGVHLRALSCRAALHLAAGEFGPAADVYSQALALARRVGDRVGESSALNNLGVARSLGGDASAAIQCWEESLAIRRSLRYFRGEAECLNNLGIAHYSAGRPAAALEQYREALKIDHQIGDRRGEGLARLNLGESTFDLSLYRTALEHTRESLVVARAIGDRDLTVRALLQLGGVHARTGEIEGLARATSELGALDPTSDALGRGALARLAGLSAGLRGRTDEALEQLSLAREALAEAGETRLAAECALDAAEIAIAAGEPGSARSALKWLERTQAVAPVRATPVLHSRRILLEAGLGESPATSAADESRTTSLSEAIAAAEQAECRELAGRGRQLLGETLAESDPGRAAGEFHRAIEHLEQVVADGSTANLERRLRIDEARAGLERARAALTGARQSAPAGPSATGALIPATGALVAAVTRADLAAAALAAVRSCVAAERALCAQVAPRSGRFEVLAQEGVFSAEELEAIQIAARRRPPEQSPQQRLLGQQAEPEPGFSSLLAGGRSALFWLPIPTPALREAEPGAATAETEPMVRFIYADSATPAPLLGEPDLGALQAFAAVTAGALLALEERTALATKLQHITRLYELSSSSVHTLDANEVIDRSMEAMIQLTQAERGFLFLIEDEGIQVKVARGATGEAIDEPTLEVSWSIVREVVEKKRAMRVDDALSDRLLSSSVSVFDLNLRSVMCVPIRSGDRLIGVAYVDHRRRTALFDDGHLRVFELFGHQIAAALENAITHAQVNEANRLKAEFLNNISHELRTPLTSIMGFTDCLRQQSLPPDAEIQVELIDRSSEVLRGLVERVLTFSALESNVLPVAKQSFSLPGLLTRLRARFANAAESKRLDLKLETARTVPPFLSGDPDRLTELLANLIDNAIKFTSEGWVALRITRESREGSGVVLGFEVEDTGIGIPLEDQERILDPFVQGDGSSTRPYGGMGLGLTTSARLVKRLGGELDLESLPGQGTSIRFQLPFDIAASAPDEP